VNYFVCGKIVCTIENLAAFLTFERFLARVNSLMLHKVESSCEAAVTLIALVFGLTYIAQVYQKKINLRFW